MKYSNYKFWFEEQDQQQMMQPVADPNANPDPSVTNMPQQPDTEPPAAPQNTDQPDISADPETPDMPEDKPKHDDFEVWRNDYLKELAKGDVNQLIAMLMDMRNEEGNLSSYQRSFIENNLAIQRFRYVDGNIAKACDEIRKLIKDQLDRNNPSTSIVNSMVAVLDKYPMLSALFIKASGYGSNKADIHRKLIAALIGFAQVSTGGNTEDLIYDQPGEYSIRISTRMNSSWGEVPLGNWELREDDPQRYLAPPEVKRLEEGSPEEKDILQKRVVIESIAKFFETRGFIITSVGDDGTIFNLGWDLAGSLKAAYGEGKMIIKKKSADNSEILIDKNGDFVPLVNLAVYFSRETGEQDEDGNPQTEEVEFLEKRQGMLFLTASLQTLRETAKVLQGMAFKEVPYSGNPSDLQQLIRCVYTAPELLLRQC